MSFAATARLLTVATSTLLLVSACSWFKTKVDYESSSQSQKLEVPPELNAPVATGAMTIPPVGPNAGKATAQVPAPVVTEASAGSSFELADGADSAFRRLGLALKRIDGVNVQNTAAALKTYDVGFDGASFLLRVDTTGSGSRISALGADGRADNSAASASLMAQLKSRLR